MSAQKNHCSLHTMSVSLVKAMVEELKGVKVSGATIHFTPEEPLSRAFIELIVQERMKEAESAWAGSGYAEARRSFLHSNLKAWREWQC
jgi:hypothetical protein